MGLLDILKGKVQQKGNSGDDSAYQANFDYFTEKKCPYCNVQLKQIEKKSNCPACKETIIVERHYDSKKKMLLTKEQAEKLEIENKHFKDLKWAVQLAEELEFSQREIAQMVKSPQVNTKFSALWVRANDTAMRHARSSKWLSYRNIRMIMGDIMKRDGHLQRALEFYLAVCFIDLNGPDDEGVFDAKKGTVNPSLLNLVLEIAQELNLSTKDLRELYITSSTPEKNRLMPLSPEQAWVAVQKKLTAKVK